MYLDHRLCQSEVRKRQEDRGHGTGAHQKTRGAIVSRRGAPFCPHPQRSPHSAPTDAKTESHWTHCRTPGTNRKKAKSGGVRRWKPRGLISVTCQIMNTFPWMLNIVKRPSLNRLFRSPMDKAFEYWRGAWVEEDRRINNQ